MCHFCCKFIDPTYHDRRNSIIQLRGISFDPATNNPEDTIEHLMENQLTPDEILSVPRMERTASLITADLVEVGARDSTDTESALRRQSISQKRTQVAKATSQLPPMEILKELNTPVQPDELDHIVIVKKSDYKDATTAAMESVVEELNKHTNIGQYAEIRFTTELALGMDHIEELARSQSQSTKA